MIIAGCGIYRNIGDDLAVDLHIDLINTVAQILIVMRRDKNVTFDRLISIKSLYIP